MGMLDNAAQTAGQGAAPQGTPQAPAPQPGVPLSGAQAAAGMEPLPPTEQVGKPPPQEGFEPANSEEQAEYERAANAMVSLVYGDAGGDKASNTIADSILAEDKIGSAVQMGVTLIAEVDKKIDMDDVVIPQIVEDTVTMLADVAEQKNGISFSPEEMESTLMGVWEGVMYMMGGDAEIQPDFDMATEGMSPGDIQNMEKEYQARLGGAMKNQEAQQMSAVQPQPQQQVGGPPSGIPS